MITLVSGIPRSGTSLMMQMVREAGIPLLHDNTPKSDENNPNGYQEWSKILQMENAETRREFGLRAPGKAVKVLTHNLHLLPRWIGEYRCVFMLRDINSIMASQSAFVTRQHSVARFDPKVAFRALKLARKKAIATLRDITKERVHFIHFENLAVKPWGEAYLLAKFLQVSYSQKMLAAMAEVIMPGLMHHGGSIENMCDTFDADRNSSSHFHSDVPTQVEGGLA
jgi:hypothetical protein